MKTLFHQRTEFALGDAVTTKPKVAWLDSIRRMRRRNGDQGTPLEVAFIDGASVPVEVGRAPAKPLEAPAETRRAAKKALLVCPDERTAVAGFADAAPLVTVPMLGESLVEYWLEHLAGLGASQVFVLAADRPEQVRAVTGDGARWGLKVEVLPEARELTPAEARAKYHGGDATDWLPEPDDAVLMDHLPGVSRRPLFNSYAGWFAASLDWMPRAATPNRVGVRELRAGVWVGLHSHVSRSAELRAPCWVGERVHVGPHTIIGPGAILEDRVFVEASSEISYSAVGPETFVGKLTDVEHSLVWGSMLIDWRDGSRVEVPDPFLLCSLGSHDPSVRAPDMLRRPLDFYYARQRSAFASSADALLRTEG
ncbi:MAG TPA: hypothetical protein VI454_07000 [Verrucomicrobiae bacterium]|jgi:hypothetical protein